MRCLLAALLLPDAASAQQVVGDYVYTCPTGLQWNDPRCLREPVQGDRGDAVRPPAHAPGASFGPVAANTAYWALAMGIGSDGRSGYALGADPVSAQAADRIVLRRCRSAGIGECRIVHRYATGVFAIAQAADGGFVHGVYPYPSLTSQFKQRKPAEKAAGAAVVEACSEQTGTRCRLLQIVPSNDWVGYDE
ncbi:DUF4189 domain-containing protein [Lysobacter sp. BMK333-48F3]|uniref:DUF4189 domain-containing protein n=1 Tax=Lysobacter sp. BMK333-48F3 TaxID=2867962 RepID=UPI002104BD7E|nr:DUF4189 domain-containing protein [Lysobacter sp. BMK333-48F3]